jgi:hypothetical protein
VIMQDTFTAAQSRELRRLYREKDMWLAMGTPFAYERLDAVREDIAELEKLLEKGM